MKRPRLKPKALLALLAAPIIAAGGLLATGGTAQAAANPGPGFPAQFSAPYTESWNGATAMTTALTTAGQKYFTLAFVIDAGSCNAMINGNIAVTDASWTSAVNTVRASGGDVMVSFGGASGSELATTCSSVSLLEAQYKKVIDALNVTRVDFDIEGAPLDNTTANDNRNTALADLQTQYAAAGKNLQVQYTLPSATTGLLADSISLLNSAKNHNVNVSGVNLMTMDYGVATDMGNAAISAANGLHTQLGSIWTTKTSAQLWAMEGNTPMLGINDTTSEIFSTSDATDLYNFAKTNGIGELSYWALGRDKACTTTPAGTPTTCSGTSQTAYQFATIFKAITSGTTTTTPPTTPPPTTPPSGATGPIVSGFANKCVDVAGAATANGTAIQLYDCNGTAAQSWTVASNGSLQSLGKCLDVTSAGTADGTTVQLYDCNGTAAQTWTKSGSTLVNANSGKCLDATGNSSANGTRLQIWTCYGSTNQVWTLPA